MDSVLTAGTGGALPRSLSLCSSKKPPLLKSDADDDTYYHTDLIGLNVQDLQRQL